LFKAVRYVKGDEPKNAVTTFEQLKGMRVTRPFREDEPIKTQDLMIPKSSGSGEPLDLPKGTRAIAIRVSSTVITSGFFLPGSRVDVISTTRKDGNSVSSTIFRNVLVLAVDSVPIGRDETGPVANTIAIALALKDIEKIRSAEANSELSVLLCPPDEESGKPKPPVRSPGEK